MSAMGQKRTLLTEPFYVCFAPESGHPSTWDGREDFMSTRPKWARKLEKDAVKNGRSLSQEAEFRLERSYDRDEIFTHLALFKDDLRAGIEAWLEGGEKRK